MTIEQFAHLFGLASWLILALVCIPSLLRLLSNRATPFDPFKATLFFVGAAQVNLTFVRTYYEASLWNYTGVGWWTISVVVLGAAVITLLVVIRKTEKALGPSLKEG